jgi:hypothetical protein
MLPERARKLRIPRQRCDTDAASPLLRFCCCQSGLADSIFD